jgi:hypothetical protein
MNTAPFAGARGSLRRDPFPAWPSALLHGPGGEAQRGVLALREAATLSEHAGVPGGRRVRVTLIREGLASSGRYYTAAALDDIYRQVEGLRAFADHPSKVEDYSRPARSVRDIVGYYTDPERVPSPNGAVKATLHVLESAAWLWSLIQEALHAGRPELVGLSIDAVARVRPAVAQQPDGQTLRVTLVEGVPLLKSCDIVTRAAAGGALERLLEGQREGSGTQDRADTREQSNGSDRVDRSDLHYRDQRADLLAGSDAGPGMTEEAVPPLPGAAGRIAELEQELARVRAAAERAAGTALLEARLAQSTLPEPVKAKLRRRFAGQAVDEHALEAALDEEAEALAALRRMGLLAGTSRDGGLITGHGTPKHELVVGPDGVSRGLAAVQLAMDRLFGVRESAARLPGGASPPVWTSLREAYVQITGDAAVSGRVFPERSIIREANEVTTTVMASVVLNSMTRRLIQDYQGQPQDWRRFCTIRAIRDFKTQDRIRLFDFSSLSTVAENAAYTNLAWDDAKESYTPAKRGNLVYVTREMILNDDLDAVRKIPQKLAVAAGITINEFVYGLFTANAGAGPAMADGFNVFDAANHANAGTSALSSAGLQAALIIMLKQTNSGGKRLGIRPRFLLVPPDLLFTALTIVNSTLVPGSNNNDANVLKGVVEVISVPQFTDTNNWYLLTDPAQVETIEIGFVGGQETPELLLQDGPTDGAVFTNDAITYKIRWEFGGGWVDYRGAYGALVA